MEWVLGKLLGAPVIGAILQPIVNGLLTAQKQKLDAAGSHDARVVELAQQDADLTKRQNELQAQIIVAEQGNWFTRIPRPVMGCAAAILVTKILVWDLAFGQWTGGHTDKLSDQAFWLLTTIVAAYFISRTVEKTADRVAGIFRKA